MGGFEPPTFGTGINPTTKIPCCLPTIYENFLDPAFYLPSASRLPNS